MSGYAGAGMPGAKGDPGTDGQVQSVAGRIGDVVLAVADVVGAAAAVDIPPSIAAVTPAVAALIGPGIDGTGVADSTAAMQAKIDAAPAGAVIYAPLGYYRHTGLVFTDGKKLDGPGWWALTDNLAAFASGGWASAANYGGAVFICTAAAGKALSFEDTETMAGFSVRNIASIGSGAGTASGLALGLAAHAVVKAEVSNVLVGDFALGVDLNWVENSTFTDLSVRGCTNGVSCANNTNANHFYNLQLERITTVGFNTDASSIGNHVHGGLAQANTGTCFALRGTNNHLYGVYFENVGGTWAVDVIAGSKHGLHDLHTQSADDDLRIQAGVAKTLLTGWSRGPNGASLSNFGDATVIIGDVLFFADGGTNTVIVNDTYGVQTPKLSVGPTSASAQLWKLDNYGRPLHQAAGTPTIVNGGANNGGAPVVTQFLGGNDVRGRIGIGTGAAPAPTVGAVMATVTFVQPYANIPSAILLFAANAAGAVSAAFVGSGDLTVNGFSVRLQTPLANNQAIFWYEVVA